MIRRFSAGAVFLLVGIALALSWITADRSNAAHVRGEGAARARPAALGPCDSDIIFGEVVSCTIASPGAERNITFSGAAGDRIRILVVKTSGALEPLMEVKRPVGSVVCPATFSDSSTCVLDTAGTHTVRIRDNAGTSTGSFNLAIQRLNNPVGCPTIAYGNPGKTGAIALATELDCYSRATVAVGDVLRVRAAETSGTLSATTEVIRPDGTTLCQSFGNTEMTCTADVAGTHWILVEDSVRTNTGAYTLHLQRLNNPIGCTTIVYGDPATPTTIGAAAEVDCYRFSGASGDQARIRVVKTSGTLEPLTEVTRPNGTTVCANTFSDDFTCVLSVTGMHTILVRDNQGAETGGYTVELDKL